MMLRVSFKFVLMLFVALPYGVCFCQYVEASPAREASDCCESETPAPEETPDHDADCPCKLREVPAAGPAPVEAARDLSALFALIVTADPAIAQAVDPDRDQSPHFRAPD